MSADIWLALAWELALFAGFVGAIFAFDDLAVDALWLGGVGRRPQPLARVSPPPRALRYAIFVPAWREGEVVGAMLRHMRDAWPWPRYRVYVGAYPNDAATIAAVSELVGEADWLQLVIVDRPGPTTKGHCLNHLWHRLCADRARGSFVPDAVLIHDAEDVVARDELLAHDAALALADYSQTPVIPLVHPAGRWMSGHYCDEFAESHLKELAVREAMGAVLPTAGVGCAIRVAALDRLAGRAGPFSHASLTEDYELGLRLGASGARGRLALYSDDAGQLVGTRSLFPHSFSTAVRQKTRWTHGIALSGWARLGWPTSPGGDALDRLAGLWMLWRDRRTLVSALAILAGYTALVVTLAVAVIAPQSAQPTAADPILRLLAVLMTIILCWRLVMRALFSMRMHGWQQGLLAIPRLFISNIVLVACSWRALVNYLHELSGRPVVWDKTLHHFPATMAAKVPRA